MVVTNNRSSTHTQLSDFDRPKSSDNAKKDMWSAMLDSVASGKRLPEKNILVLGGTSDSQKEFLESLSSDSSIKRQHDRHSSKPALVANNFALGYTYQDVLDADHEDVLARLSIYLLADPSPTFTPLLRPLLTPTTIGDTLVVVLLDWAEPWNWLRQLRDWIRLLRKLLVSLDEESKSKMEEVMISWRDHGRNALGVEGSSAVSDADINLPRGPGEWEEALGLPLCVVCQNADKIEVLERERAWKDEEFDFVLQILRTVLLKHGASLIYTIPSAPGPLQSLIHSSLGIHSLLKRQPLKHNVIDRDKVMVPPNWDSWGKIRVLREGFDVEAVSKGWSVDIEDSQQLIADQEHQNGDRAEALRQTNGSANGGALAVFEETITNPTSNASRTSSSKAGELEVESQDPQGFLSTQFEVLERMRQGANSSHDRKRDGSTLSSNDYHSSAERGTVIADDRVSEHIGPVQFNMGGIQVDAEDMLQRLKDRQSHQTPEPETPRVASPDGKSQNEALASFFANLMKRGGGGSATGSPKPEV